MTFWTVVAVIIFACIFIMGGIVAKALKAGRDYDDRMDDIIKGKHRYNYPKKY